MLDGLEMRFIRAKLSGASPECVVLISETAMWDDYPQEYSQFLSGLSDVFPQSKLYYFGRSNNHVSEDFGSKICSVEVSSLDPQVFKDRCIIWYGFSHRLSESALTRAILKGQLCQHEDSEFFVYDYDQAEKFNSSLSIQTAEEEAVSPDSIVEAEDDSIITMAPRKVVRYSMFRNKEGGRSSPSPFNKGCLIVG